MWKFKFILITIFCLLGFFHSGLAQAPIQNTNLQLTVTYSNTAIVQLAWTSPQFATSCTLEHRTPAGTQNYPLPSYLLNSTQIPAWNPTQPWDTFTIYFTMLDGTVQYDVDVLKAAYGGVILVEEEIFFLEVADSCYFGHNADQFDFLWHKILADANMVCEISDEYLAAEFPGYYGPPKPNEVDFVKYTGHVINKLKKYIAQNHPGVMAYRAIDISDPRLAFQSRPNPITDRLIINAPTGNYLPKQSQHIFAYNQTGERVYQSQNDFKEASEYAISTASWPPGLYYITIGEGPSRTTMKVLKH